MKVSGIITTFNEESNIADCIKSLQWCDEIIVVDSFSTDKTLKIAAKYDKVRVLQREYYGSASQKNWAMDQAQYSWMMILDADERCSIELKQEILELLKNPHYEAYSILRKTYFLGRVINYSGWKHDKVVRLVKKGGGRCPYKRAHGGVIAYSKAPLLKSQMIHYMVDSIKSYMEHLKTQSYWGAAQFYVDNRRINPFTIIIHSFWRFFRTYFFQLGFLDGYKGLVFCLAQAYGTFLKYSLCWYWKINKLRGIEPILPAFDTEIENWYK